MWTMRGRIELVTKPVAADELRLLTRRDDWSVYLDADILRAGVRVDGDGQVHPPAEIAAADAELYNLIHRGAPDDHPKVIAARARLQQLLETASS